MAYINQQILTFSINDLYMQAGNDFKSRILMLPLELYILPQNILALTKHYNICIYGYYITFINDFILHWLYCKNRCFIIILVYLCSNLWI